jgi:hypothetical protein
LCINSYPAHQTKIADGSVNNLPDAGFNRLEQFHREYDRQDYFPPADWRVG